MGRTLPQQVNTFEDLEAIAETLNADVTDASWILRGIDYNDVHTRKNRALTGPEALELWVRYHTTDATYRDLTEAYGVSMGSVQQIIYRESYQDVDMPEPEELQADRPS
jgi:hypothetical protein